MCNNKMWNNDVRVERVKILDRERKKKRGGKGRNRSPLSASLSRRTSQLNESGETFFFSHRPSLDRTDKREGRGDAWQQARPEGRRWPDVVEEFERRNLC